MDANRKQMLTGNNIMHVRSRNKSVVLETIFRVPGICRRDIGRVTGLAAGAVSDITKELITEKLIMEASRKVRKREKVGRTPIGLYVNSESVWAIGSLIARDGITVGLSDLNGNIALKKQKVLESIDLDFVQTELVNSIEELIASAEQLGKTVAGIGVSIPGMVFPDTGVVPYSTVLGWRDVMLRSRLQQFFSLPIAIDNDVRGVALARYWFDNEPHDEFLLVYFGDGIACCSVQHGHISAGHSGAAGQIGHSIVDPNGPPCICGNQGCFERVTSPEHIQAYMEEEIQGGAVSSADRSSLAQRSLSTATICKLLDQGDEAARKAFRRIGKYFGIVLSNLIKIYDPPALVLLGELFSGSDFATEIVKQEMYAHFLYEQRSPDIAIWNTSEINDLRLVGSAMLALDRFVLRPDSLDVRKPITKN